MESRGVEATVIGEFTSSTNMIVQHQGKTIMDIDMEFLHNGLPRHHLQTTSVVNKYDEPKLPEETSRTKVLESLLGEKKEPNNEE